MRIVRFEDLVGGKGGGSAAVQANAVRAVADYLEINLDTTRLEQIQSELFGSSGTFRTGQIDSWRTELSDTHKRVLVEELGPLLGDLGYCG